MFKNVQKAAFESCALTLLKLKHKVIKVSQVDSVQRGW